MEDHPSFRNSRDDFEKAFKRIVSLTNRNQRGVDIPKKERNYNNRLNRYFVYLA